MTTNNGFSFLKKFSLVRKLIVCLIFLLLFVFLSNKNIFAQTTPTPTPNINYVSCGCPRGTTDEETNQLNNFYQQYGEQCVDNYDQWAQDPLKNHFWVKDPEITAQGKADERARQFIYWVINHNSIDSHPTLFNIWTYTRNIAYFLLILIAAVMGIGIIVSQRANYDFKIQVWPSIFKILTLLLYISLSAALVVTIIQITDVLMKFFIERLGGKDLFNIYFASISQEKNYLEFEGCRDLSWKVQEAARAEIFLLKLTNVTYYVMGSMLILRKVVLWFLLFVSPFLAILLPFVFIRNTGWIWIGVFFQWVFYGPLFALFLGGLSKIWRAGIPFPFDFSRINTAAGYVYPTATNILYGGPAQQLRILNNGNYVDTFVEYVITLIMLWAVVFFPWWLLRIFRDYCCEGIYAAKNILMSIYDQMRGGQIPSFPPTIPSISTIGTALKIPKGVEIPIKVRLETMEEIKKTKTEEITRSLNLSVSRLTDVAHFETNRQTQETVRRNLDYLANPTRAETPTERQKYMNIRTELFNRAIKEDKIAKQVLSSISTSKIEQIQKREEIAKTIPQVVPVTQVVSVKVKMPQTTVNSINSSFINSAASNNSVVNTIAQTTQIPAQQVQSILTNLSQNINQPVNKIVNNISQQTNVSKEKIVQVLRSTNNLVKQLEIVAKTAVKENVVKEHVEKITQSLSQISTTIQEKRPLVKILSENCQLPEEKTFSITNNLLTAVTTDTNFLNQIGGQTNLQQSQVQNVAKSFIQNINQPADTIVNNIEKQTGVEKEKVLQVITTVVNNLKMAKDIIKETAQKQNFKEEDVEKVVQTQIPLLTEPEKNIEQTVTIPPTVSIEDYEEVKKMWTTHYEKGEIPITENVVSRTDWVNQDIVFITNTLNKLLSSDEKLRNEGLDDLGYILPIFLINNLKGEELVVYLKAKLEAAKTVAEQLEKEKQLTKKLKAKAEEELVEVEKPKQKEKEKTLEMAEEIKPEVTNPESKNHVTNQQIDDQTEIKN